VRRTLQPWCRDSGYFDNHFSELKPWMLGVRAGGKKVKLRGEPGSSALRPGATQADCISEQGDARTRDEPAGLHVS
jgi:hypothetical protein